MSIMKMERSGDGFTLRPEGPGAVTNTDALLFEAERLADENRKIGGSPPIVRRNPSGVRAIDLRVIVKPDQAVKKIGSIHLPDQEADKLKYAGTKGTLISVGENAFKDAGPDFVRPVPGDRVMFALYGGTKFKGDDGEEYLIMNDEDILGRLEK